MTPRHIQGPLVKHAKRKPDALEFAEAMVAIKNGTVKDLQSRKGWRNATHKKERSESLSKPRTQTRKQEEREIQNRILAWLEIHGVVAHHIKTKGVRLPSGVYLKHKNTWKGVLDILAFTKKSLWWIEVKTATGRLTPEQKVFIALCIQTNTKYLVAICTEDLKPIIDEQMEGE